MSNKPPMSNKPMFEKPKSKLFRPDPYYIPGYCGYCPMQKYQLGETYGKTTANILTDPVVSVTIIFFYFSSHLWHYGP